MYYIYVSLFFFFFDVTNKRHPPCHRATYFLPFPNKIWPKNHFASATLILLRCFNGVYLCAWQGFTWQPKLGIHLAHFFRHTGDFSNRTTVWNQFETVISKRTINMIFVSNVMLQSLLQQNCYAITYFMFWEPFIAHIAFAQTKSDLFSRICLNKVSLWLVKRIVSESSLWNAIDVMRKRQNALVTNLIYNAGLRL